MQPPRPDDAPGALRDESDDDLCAQVALAFSSQGVLARSDPMLAQREVQQRLAHQVARAIAARSPLVAEAGTGVGKTFAYLVPLLLSGRRALVSTATKSLQDQLFLRDLPRLRDALRVPVRMALLKGRASARWWRAKATRRATASATPSSGARRCVRWPASSNGRRPRAAATWPRSTAWTTARR
jgi:ATP-dependent DNA helicase DinG